MIKKERIDYIDFIRGIGIIYMVLGHIIVDANFDHYIHAFHMPLFFILSGMFMKKSDNISFKQYTIKLLKSLIIPYILWGTFLTLFSLKTGIGITSNYVERAYNILFFNNKGLLIGGALWFLTSLFFSNIIYYLMRKTIKNPIILSTLSFALMLISMYLFSIYNINLPWSINASLVGVGLLNIGSILHDFKVIDRVKINNKIVTLIVFIFVSLISIKLINTTQYVNMRLGEYPNIILFCINVLLPIYSFFLLFELLDSIVFKKAVSFIKHIGKNSIVAVCTNQLIIVLYNEILLEKNIIFSNYFVKATIVIAVICLLTKLLMNSKVKIIFGK